EGDEGTQVADVRRRLRGRAAHVEADLARDTGGEVAQLARRGVEQSKGHPGSVPATRGDGGPAPAPPAGAVGERFLTEGVRNRAACRGRGASGAGGARGRESAEGEG